MAEKKGLPETRRSTRRSPSTDLLRLQRNIDQMFDEFMTPFQFGGEGLWGGVANQPYAFTPACDVEETPHQFLISFDLPGLSKDEIKIEVRNHQLVVSGERKFEAEREGERQVSVERSYGSFLRVFDLPSIAKSGDVEAHYENGVLQVVIPKSEEALAKVIPIKEHKGGFFGKLLGGHKEEVPVQKTEESRVEVGTEEKTLEEVAPEKNLKKKTGHAA